MTKFKSASELQKIIEKHKTFKKKIGFTNGCFDILHSGHVKYLKESKNNCDILIIGVNSDDSVKRLKGPERPINSEKDRVEVLSALECVDYITIFGEDTPLELIKELSPDVIFKGGDWEEDKIVGADFVKSNGGEVMVIPYVKGYSTTGIIKRMKK